MRKIVSAVMLVLMVALLLPGAPAVRAQVPIPGLPDQMISNCFPYGEPGGQIYLFCLPTTVAWNGDLVIYAHGYVPPGVDGFPVPLEASFAQLTTPDGATFIPDMITQMGFAFAFTTYSKNGLAVVEGLQDVIALATTVAPMVLGQPPAHTFLVGASEGGLITTLAMETPNTPFTAGVAACGPVGNFRQHINYLGDFRALFDYFFKNVPIPVTAVNVDPAATLDWLQPLVGGTSTLQAAILQALQANPGAAAQLISTSKAAVDPHDPASIGKTVISVLGYNLTATMESQVEIGQGSAVQTFNNLRTWYYGSKNDLLLNSSKGVKRYALGPAGMTEAQLAVLLKPYETTGKLQGPLVTIHTLMDPEVPVWHQTLYRAKVWKQNNAALYNGIPINRYGHCNFNAQELLFAFALAYTKGTHQLLSMDGVNQALPSDGAQQQFNDLMKQYGPVTQ